jgi:hypothetical protein
MRRSAEWISKPRYSSFPFWYEDQVIDSLQTYMNIDEDQRLEMKASQKRLLEPAEPEEKQDAETDPIVFVRNPDIRGPMSVFGYDYLEDHYGKEKTAALKLLKAPNGSIYAYEILNLMDGDRDVQEILNILSDAYGPVSAEMVEEYLVALEVIGAIRKK